MPAPTPWLRRCAGTSGTRRRGYREAWGAASRSSSHSDCSSEVGPARSPSFLGFSELWKPCPAPTLGVLSNTRSHGAPRGSAPDPSYMKAEDPFATNHRTLARPAALFGGQEGAEVEHGTSQGVTARTAAAFLATEPDIDTVCYGRSSSLAISCRTRRAAARAAGCAVIAMLLSVGLESQAQQLCGRVVSIQCARPSQIATFTVRTDRNAQFQVMIPAEHRAAFGDDIETPYEFRSVCVSPRAVQDRQAVVHAPGELQITAAPTRTLPPLPAGVYRPCQADIDVPQPKTTKHPSYTREAMRERIEGSVMMRVVLTAEGRPGDILIVESLRRDLDTAAVDAMKQWRFRPATHSGMPVAVAVLVEMSFHLR